MENTTEDTVRGKGGRQAPGHANRVGHTFILKAMGRNKMFKEEQVTESDLCFENVP